MLSKRVQRLKPSPTLALAAKAKELEKEGHDVISLSVGEPDWDTFPGIKAAAVQALNEGFTKYTPSNGIPELRKAICEQTNQDLGTRYADSQVTVTAGGKFVIFSALQALVDPGDEVVIPSPYWVSYPTMVELADGLPRIAVCEESSNFKLTPAILEKTLSKKTKMVILNSPSNPTGLAYTREELGALAEVLRQHPQVWIMSDDIYNRLVFSESGLAPHILQVAPDLTARTVIINGASKTYSMTGWRVGWALGAADVIKAMTNYQSQSVSCATAFAQKAALYAIKHGEQDLRDSLEVLKKRRDLVCSMMRDIRGIELLEPQGAFYIWPKISHYFNKSWQGKKLVTSKDWAEALLESQKVAAVPGIEFGTEGYLRLSYALSEKRMSEAVARLKAFIGELR